MTPARAKSNRHHEDYITRVMTRLSDIGCGGVNLDLIDTTDYRDIFNTIKPDSHDLHPAIYLPKGRFQ